jgi:hypothetical protein
MIYTAPGSQRWTACRKLALLDAMDMGVISQAEAAEIYQISYEELAEWLRRRAIGGKSALRATFSRARLAKPAVTPRQSGRRPAPQAAGNHPIQAPGTPS